MRSSGAGSGGGRQRRTRAASRPGSPGPLFDPPESDATPVPPARASGRTPRHGPVGEPVREPIPPPEYEASLIPGESPLAPIDVATLTAATRDILEGALPPLWVRGEIVGFKEHRNGHWYFTLKDDAAQIRCVVWASDTRRILAPPDEGMAVVVRGRLTMFTGRGELQFRVTALEGIGDGLWRKAFEQTRARLEADGLLDPARKRPLPPFPRCVAVVTSTDGAALHDIVVVIRRRCPLTRVVVVPAIVQGSEAPRSVRKALERVARWQGAEVVIVGRGGGGREDLWAFNDERLARAVAAVPVPVVSAVGHEIDVTLCDLVADYRAPTPSAAAEAVVPVLADLVRRMRSLATVLADATHARLDRARRAAMSTARATQQAASRVLERRRLGLESAAGRLQALSPLTTLARGYAAVSVDGRPITSTSALAPGMAFDVRLRDGRVTARAEHIEAFESTDQGRVAPIAEPEVAP